MQQERHGPGAPPNNDNASNKRKGLPRGYYTKLSINGRVAARIEAELTEELGRKPTLEESRARVKEVFSKAIFERYGN